jgi:carbamoyl-phosphate synthase large subunit
VLDKLGLASRPTAPRSSEGEAAAFAAEVGYPVLLRPSFVLGGRGMFIVYSEEELKAVVRQVFEVMPGKPVLIDKFLEDAIELDVDCLSDGETSVIGGMLEHIEYAGVHSGDAAMVMPPHTLGPRRCWRRCAPPRTRWRGSCGHRPDERPVRDQGRTSSTSSRSTRAPRAPCPSSPRRSACRWPSYAAKVMAGMKLGARLHPGAVPKHWCVKEAVFPFVRFPGATIALGPEMRSTGEVMGLDADLGIAFAKAQAAAKPGLPTGGNVFLSVKDADKPRAVEIARAWTEMGFTIYSTSGTAKTLADSGIAGEAAREDQRGPPERRRHDQERPDPDGDQHARRE